MTSRMINTVSILLIGISVVAKADDLTAIKACAQIEDSLKRLVCYDQAAAALVDKKSTKKAATTAVTTKKASPALKQPTEVVNTPVTEKSSKKEQFGIEHVKNQQKTKEQESEEQDVTFIVKSLDKSIRKRWIIAFENGQVWKQNDTEYINLSVGDTVHLSKGLFGAIYLKKDGSNRRIKVRRQK